MVQILKSTSISLYLTIEWGKIDKVELGKRSVATFPICYNDIYMWTTSPGDIILKEKISKYQPHS